MGMTHTATHTEYADKIVELFRRDLAADPARFESCRSWDDVNEVADVNEYAVEVDEILGVDMEGEPWFALINTAMDIAEAIIWPKPTIPSLSPRNMRDILSNLSAFDTETALRGVELHRTRGDFSSADCDRLAEVVRSGRAWMATFS